MVAALWVALGGALGTLARYGVGVGVVGAGGPAWAATLLVNGVGAFAMGMVAGSGVAGTPRAFLATGVLGGLTTFSALTLDTATLAEGGGGLRAAAYAAGSVGLGLVAFLLGRLAARGAG